MVANVKDITLSFLAPVSLAITIYSTIFGDALGSPLASEVTGTAIRVSGASLVLGYSVESVVIDLAHFVTA